MVFDVKFKCHEYLANHDKRYINIHEKNKE